MKRKPIIIAIASLAIFVGSSAQASKEASWATLAQRADNEVRNGGVYSRRWGAASPKLKALVTTMIYKKFGHGYNGKRMWCYANRESGLNPWALSRTGDHHVFQFNHYAHHRTLDFNRLDKPDVAYGIIAAYRMSKGGTSVSPWAGGAYSCPRGNEP